MTVHNHGPEEGAGLSCNESRLPDGSLRGACMDDDIPTMGCLGDGCEKTIQDTFEGRNKAWENGWYLLKWGSGAYCPDDIPVSISSSFKKSEKK